jgi:hypothetical protein
VDLIDLSQIRTAASLMKAKKAAPSLSYRVAIRLNCFSLLKKRSIRLRSR